MDGSQHLNITKDDTSKHTDDFKIRGAATRAQPARKDAALDACTICLQPISERAVAVPCNHLTFDFLCLVSWLQERSTCPLCNAKVAHVQYDWRSPNDFKTYHVPPVKVDGSLETVSDSRTRHDNSFSRQRHVSRAIAPVSTSAQDSSLERRRRVYASRTYSQHVGANSISQYRDFTPSSFSCSPQLQSRARAFLRRELQVFPFLEESGCRRGFLLEYIIAVLKFHEIKGASGEAEELVAEYLGKENAMLLLHELQAWLRSPYERLEDWDKCVQYGLVENELSLDIKVQ